MKGRFPLAQIAAGVLLLGAVAGVGYWVVDDATTAQHSYHQLLQMANPVNSRQDPSSYTAKQKREGVQKSFYFTPSKSDKSQELRLFATNSELVLSRGSESEVLERMEDLRTLIQESLYYTTPEGKASVAMTEGSIPTQKITYLESETAECNYTNGRLEAHRAEITRFTLPGHQLISDIVAANFNPYQSASAENVDLRYRQGIVELAGNVAIDHHEGKDLLQLTCDHARLYEENHVPVVEAEQHVTLVFNSSYTATGEYAHYAKGAVYVLGKGEKCLLTSLAGDQIHSDRIDLSLLSKILQMENPSGLLFPTKNDPVPLKFGARQLLWNHELNQLVLHSDVEISHPSLGTLKNDDEVHIFRTEGKGGGALEKIISEGHSTLTRREPQTQRLYTLTCEGRVMLDHVKGNVELTAADPVDSPVHLKDEFGEIFADKAQVIYTPTEGKLQTPQRIILTGNVKIINRNSLAEDPLAVIQMALADRVEMEPTTNKMVFYANKKKRVLFYDKGNDLQISAPKLTIRRDQMTKKESFEGAGDVRFSFQDREIAQLREKFSLPFMNNKDKK